MRHTFSKAERLCHKQHIDALFLSGERLLVYPLLFSFLRSEPATPPVKVVISVSKKRFAHATDRNRVKRIIREVYRTNKHLFSKELADAGCSLHLSISYVAREHSEQAVIAASWEKAWPRIAEMLFKS